ncbi:MAG: TonB-dependent receptor [Terricaulis sp.]
MKTLLDVTPYGHRNEGIGEWLPPYQEPRFASTANPAALQQVLFGGSRIRTTRSNLAGRAVLPFAAGGVERVYTALDGTVVRSSECFNSDNTVRVSGGQEVCALAQSYRNSEYYHSRTGVVANVEWELGAHTLRGGVWYENLDRDFGRAWKPYLDIRLGPIALGSVYRRDFAQNFQTDLWKVYLSDTWDVTDRLTLNIGLQSYFIDIAGTSLEDANFTAGIQTSVRNSSVNSDSQDLLPAIGVVYDATDSLQLFAGWSRNFGAIGDWALEKTGTDLSSLEPEVTDNFEAGLRFRGDQVRAAMTVYHNQYDRPIVFLTNDFAVGTPGINYSAGTGGTYFNITGGIESTGVEGSVEYDFTESLTGYLAASYTNAEYTNAFNAASYGGNPVVVPAGATVAGTPDVILVGAISYEEGPFAARLSARHIGEAPGDAANTTALLMPSYTLVDLSARYRVEMPEDSLGSYVELGLAVNNLTDERYIAGMLDEFTQRYNVGAPRTTSFTVSMSF